MSENKEEIRYTLKFYSSQKKEKMRLRLLKKFVMFMDMMQYQYHGTKVQAFSSRNFDVKDAPCSCRSITRKIDKIMEKVEQDRH